MAKYDNVNGTTREVKHRYENVNGTIREVKEKYENVNGTIRKVFGDSGIVIVENGVVKVSYSNIGAQGEGASGGNISITGAKITITSDMAVSNSNSSYFGKGYKFSLGGTKNIKKMYIKGSAKCIGTLNRSSGGWGSTILRFGENYSFSIGTYTEYRLSNGNYPVICGGGGETRDYTSAGYIDTFDMEININSSMTALAILFLIDLYKASSRISANSFIDIQDLILYT